jgi:hypothetical protein
MTAYLDTLVTLARLNVDRFDLGLSLPVNSMKALRLHKGPTVELLSLLWFLLAVVDARVHRVVI